MDWMKSYGGDDGASAMVSVSDGYVLVADTSSRSNGSEDLYLIKTDKNGNSLWARTFGGQKYEMPGGIVAVGDGYVIAGMTQSFGPNDDGDIYLVKTDLSGNLVWQKNFGGAGRETGYGIARASDGYVIVGSLRDPNNADDHIYLLKTDLSGNQVWQKTYNSREAGYAITAVSDGYVITGKSRGDKGVLLMKIDLTGNMVWEQYYGGRWSDEGRSVIAVSDGYVIAGTTSSYGAGMGDIYLIKADTGGNFLWQKTFGGSSYEEGNAVTAVDGGYAVVGYTALPNDGGHYDMYLIKTDADGKEIWNGTYGTTGMTEEANALAVDDGCYVMCGRSGYQGAILTKTYREGQKPVAVQQAKREQPAGTGPGMAWGRNYTIGDDYNYIRDVAAVGDGYVAVGSMNLDGKEQLFTLKVDKSGILIWSRNYTSEEDGYDVGIAILPSGNGCVALDGYAPGHQGGASLLKYDASGNLLWHKGYSGEDGIYHVSDFIPLKDGYLIVGNDESLADNPRFEKYLLLIKTDLDGNEVWARDIKVPYPLSGHSVIAVDDGYVITGDTSKSIVVFDGSNGGAAPFHEVDTFLVKTDLDGNLVWQKTYDSPLQDYGNSILAADDGYMIAGYTGEYSGGNGSIFLMKTDRDGIRQWQKLYGVNNSTFPGKMIISGNGFVVTGYSESSGYSSGDVYLMKADTDGNLLWQSSFGGADRDEGQSVIETGGQYLIGGSTNSFSEGIIPGLGTTDGYLLMTGSGNGESTSSGTGTGALVCCGSAFFLVILLLAVIAIAAAAIGYLLWSRRRKK